MTTDPKIKEAGDRVLAALEEETDGVVMDVALNIFIMAAIEAGVPLRVAKDVLCRMWKEHNGKDEQAH